MLDQSFVFLPKVGDATERRIWSSSIDTWDDFLSVGKLKGFSAARKEHLDWHLSQAKKHLEQDDHSYFHSYFPFSHQWRLWDTFKDNAIFLDIETSGYYGDVTVCGLYDGDDVVTLVRGFNLDRHNLEQALKGCKLLVTYNGQSFDLPVLRRYFNVDFDIPHLDLRFVCQRLGLFGGLKKVERVMGIKREDEVGDMSGEEAVLLWKLWRSTRERHYLDCLVAYNREDIVNLLPLAESLVPSLWARQRSLR